MTTRAELVAELAQEAADNLATAAPGSSDADFWELAEVLGRVAGQLETAKRRANVVRRALIEERRWGAIATCHSMDLADTVDRERVRRESAEAEVVDVREARDAAREQAHRNGLAAATEGRLCAEYRERLATALVETADWKRWCHTAEAQRDEMVAAEWRDRALAAERRVGEAVAEVEVTRAVATDKERGR